MVFVFFLFSVQSWRTVFQSFCPFRSFSSCLYFWYLFLAIQELISIPIPCIFCLWRLVSPHLELISCQQPVSIPVRINCCPIRFFHAIWFHWELISVPSKCLSNQGVVLHGFHSLGTFLRPFWDSLSCICLWLLNLNSSMPSFCFSNLLFVVWSSLSTSMGTEHHLSCSPLLPSPLFLLFQSRFLLLRP